MREWRIGDIGLYQEHYAEVVQVDGNRLLLRVPTLFQHACIWVDSEHVFRWQSIAVGDYVRFRYDMRCVDQAPRRYRVTEKLPDGAGFKVAVPQAACPTDLACMYARPGEVYMVVRPKEEVTDGSKDEVGFDRSSGSDRGADRDVGRSVGVGVVRSDQAVRRLGMKKWILFGIVAAVCGRYAEDVPGMAASVLGSLQGVLGQMPAWQFDWDPGRLVGALAFASLFGPGLWLNRLKCASLKTYEDDPFPLLIKGLGYILMHGGLLGALAVLASGLHAFQPISV